MRWFHRSARRAEDERRRVDLSGHDRWVNKNAGADDSAHHDHRHVENAESSRERWLWVRRRTQALVEPNGQVNCKIRWTKFDQLREVIDFDDSHSRAPTFTRNNR